MGLLAVINHLINFLAPALWLALWLPLCSRFILKKMVIAHTLRAQIALQMIVGGGVLLAGLLVLGRDGKMLTYLALLLAAASTQWLLSRR